MSIACKDEIYIEDVLIWEMQFHSIASCSKKFLFDYLAKMYDDSYLQNPVFRHVWKYFILNYICMLSNLYDGTKILLLLFLSDIHLNVFYASTKFLSSGRDEERPYFLYKEKRINNIFSLFNFICFVVLQHIIL